MTLPTCFVTITVIELIYQKSPNASNAFQNYLREKHAEIISLVLCLLSKDEMSLDQQSVQNTFTYGRGNRRRHAQGTYEKCTLKYSNWPKKAKRVQWIARRTITGYCTDSEDTATW